MEKNKNTMSNRDKVAMLLTTRGFSLEEGMMMYDKMMESKGKCLVTIDRENDVVVWLECYTTDESGDTINLTVWLNYRKDFCDNYALAGAVALGDDELDIDDPKKKRPSWTSSADARKRNTARPRQCFPKNCATSSRLPHSPTIWNATPTQ